ncbi:hypothetical protein TrVFT333_005428 [Trichoderma virens FT-333]|nr:hypothetical protein TrVFT333_005428 [Trichoderma virens FT-333]
MASHGVDQERFDQPTIAARQRCWWAVYEIETFCSMMYGFPLGISDSDCDVEELNPHDGCSVSTTDEEDPGQPNLLFFKCAMSKLSRIVRCALTDLYGTHRNLDRQNRPIVDDSSRLQSLIAKVADLDERLSLWQEALPTKLRPTILQQQSAQSSAETGSAESFTEKLFHLQALILKLAYENARILVHRPLLSYKMVITENADPSNSRSCDDPFQRSVQCCRDAALQVSRIGSNPIFRQVSDTYAVTFVSLHLFTAGVTLCIMTSLDPLSRESHESKLGIRGLMEMQTILKPKSIAAAQGLDILRNLLSLVMAKEISNLFEIPSPSEESSTARDVSTSANQNPDPTSSPPQDEQPILPGSSALSDVGTEFEFCENPSMAEALLDFEHAIWYPPNIATDEEHPSVSTDDHFTPNYVGQDQAWLWGWNCSM